MSPDSNKHGGKGELVNAVVLHSEATGPWLHAAGHQIARVIAHCRPALVRGRPVTGERWRPP